MTEALFIGIGLVAGALAGAAIAWAIGLSRQNRLRADGENARARAALLDEQAARLADEIAGERAAHEEADRNATRLAEQLRQKQEQFVQQKELLTQAEQRLADTFTALGAKALQANNEQFIALAKKAFETLMTEAKGDVEKKQQAIDGLLKPIRELLDKHHTALGEMEKKREVAYKGLEEHIKAIAASHEKLGTETHRLVTALRRPEQRGRWGEMQLRNAVELAGMTPHCDFLEQPQTDDASTRDRPDMVVNLPGEAVIVVDSKVALDAYLDALDPEQDREALMKRHADHVEQHVRRLAGKQYWAQFERTPKLVVMFMPLESALTAALETRPHLHADAMRQNVLIATPTLLVALLRAVAYGWQQEAIATNARQISEVGRELYDRLAVFVDHFESVGKGLNRSTTAYNRAVGSLESRVLASARRLKELHATTKEDIESPPPLEIEVRPVTADELKSLPDDGGGTGDRTADVTDGAAGSE
ncbi:MAG: DNA recombination protein RmuC [Planctomycetota bacterium]